MLRALACLAVVAGCVNAQEVVCAGGYVCPAGDVCDAVHDSCATTDQIAQCAGKAEGAPCTSGTIEGGCFGGTCLARGCGNGIVEAGEACDDGNQVSGDGCSADCASNETCGNGVLDLPGEECDDGNRASHDGCDSRCVRETEHWQVVGIAPSAAAGAYDEARHVFVVPSGPAVWEWNGATWAVVPTTTTQIAPIAVFYDSDSAQVTALSGAGGTSAAQLFAWSGSAWEQTSTNGLAGAFGGVVATYDPDRHEVIAMISDSTVGPLQGWTLGSSGVWVQLPATGVGPVSSLAVAFDAASGHVIVEADHTELVWDGSTWTPIATTLPVPLSLVDDPVRGLVAIGPPGDDRVFVRDPQGVWNPSDPSCPDTAGSTVRAAYYDTAAAAVTRWNVGQSQPCVWAASAWTAGPAAPPPPLSLAPDPTHAGVLALSGPSTDPTPPLATWRWDGTWHQLVTPTAPPSRASFAAAWDPRRGATVLYGGVSTQTVWGDTWAFDGAAWSMIDDAGPVDGVAALLAYDPIDGALVTGLGVVPYELRSDGTRWQPGPFALPEVTALAPRTLAWAALDQRFVSTQTGDVPTVDILSGDAWSPPDLVPNGSFLAIPDAATGKILLVDTRTEHLWTWNANTFVHDPMPFAAVNAFLEPRGDQLVLLADAGGPMIIVRTIASGEPDETCLPDMDGDGDGLPDCLDPDCWWACAPMCPPFTTCGAP